MAKSIAIKTDEALLRDIHIQAAKQGLSVQQYINELIERDLFPERFPQPDAIQLETIREAVRRISADVQPILDALDFPQTAQAKPPGMELGS